MKKRECNPTNEKRYVNLKAFADYAGIGTTNARKMAVQIGAEKRIGKRCIYDLQKIDEYFAENDRVLLPFQED